MCFIVSGMSSPVFICLELFPRHIASTCEHTMAYPKSHCRFSDTVLGNVYLSFVEGKLEYRKTKKMIRNHSAADMRNLPMGRSFYIYIYFVQSHTTIILG